MKLSTCLLLGLAVLVTGCSTRVEIDRPWQQVAKEVVEAPVFGLLEGQKRTETSKYVELIRSYRLDTSGIYIPAKARVRVYKSDKPPTVCTVRCVDYGLVFPFRNEWQECLIADELRKGVKPPKTDNTPPPKP